MVRCTLLSCVCGAYVVYLYCTGEYMWCGVHCCHVCVVHMWCICTVRVSICGVVYTVVVCGGGHMWCICTVRVSICGVVYTVVMCVWYICGVFVLYG